MNLEQTLLQIRQEVLNELSLCKDKNTFEILEHRYLGRKGKLRELSTGIGNLSTDERARVGKMLNEVKSELENKFKEKLQTLEVRGEEKEDFFDVTLPAKTQTIGIRHPVYKTLDEIKEIFERLGFTAVYGPEIENEFNNFDALNMPPEHPSRDAFNTFYINESLLLRSHTSPVQIRVMKGRKPPLRIIAPGKVFRPDTPDPGHFPMFHQVEGLMVGEDVTFAHLKGVLELFVKEFFGKDTRMRFRPGYFPFVEPGAEVDMSCTICKGRGCSTCGGSGWIEILGAGMVHPKVFEAVGYDPERYTGFAFGMGVERIAMVRYGINDIRLFVENHYRFLKQFK